MPDGEEIGFISLVLDPPLVIPSVPYDPKMHGE
jgi:hypothetical protein